MAGRYREGRRLLVGMVQFVKIFVQPWPMEYSMNPVGCVVLEMKEKQIFNNCTVVSPIVVCNKEKSHNFC